MKINEFRRCNKLTNQVHIKPLILAAVSEGQIHITRANVPLFYPSREFVIRSKAAGNTKGNAVTNAAALRVSDDKRICRRKTYLE